jgi:hypothetical protein
VVCRPPHGLGRAQLGASGSYPRKSLAGTALQSAPDSCSARTCDKVLTVLVNHRVVAFSSLFTVMTPDQYSVVFDLSQKGLQWWFPAFGLIFVAIGGVLIWLGRRNRWRRSRSVVGYFMVGFACLWSGLAFATMLPEYLNLRSAYRQGHFSIAEGFVTNFRPMPYEGHQSECFSVQSETFCYSDYVVSAGFNNSASHGGPIRDGSPIRVSYIGNTIVRLEIRNDALPRASQRVELEEAAKSDWQQRQHAIQCLTARTWVSQSQHFSW